MGRVLLIGYAQLRVGVEYKMRYQILVKLRLFKTLIWLLKLVPYFRLSIAMVFRSFLPLKYLPKTLWNVEFSSAANEKSVILENSFWSSGFPKNFGRIVCLHLQQLRTDWNKIVPENRVPEKIFCFIQIPDCIVFWSIAKAQPFDLRKYKPHPMRCFSAIFYFTKSILKMTIMRLFKSF